MTNPFIEKIIPAGKSKTEFVDDLLARMSDMHSHYDIMPSDGGFALIRTYEMDDETLAEHGLPSEQHMRWTKTLDEMHDRIIKSEGLYYRRAMSRKSHRISPLKSLAAREASILQEQKEHQHQPEHLPVSPHVSLLQKLINKFTP